MGPRIREEDVPLDYVEDDKVKIKIKITDNDPDWKPMEQIVWTNVIWYLVLHIGAFYGLYLAWTQASWATIIYSKSIVSLIILFLELLSNYEQNFIIAPSTLDALEAL